MESGDLATWNTNKIVLVLEGVLAHVPTPPKKRKLFTKQADVPVPPAMWSWSTIMLKKINYMAKEFNAGYAVVTFTSPETAVQAAEYLNQHDVRIATCEYDDFEVFCESLKWRQDLTQVIDSDEERLRYYGQKGYSIPFGVEL